MTETTIATDGTPTDPRPPCSICGSTKHTTGQHDNGEPTGGVSPMGQHDNAVPTGTE